MSLTSPSKTNTKYGNYPICNDTLFPEGFYDIGNMTFYEVYQVKKEFVEFIKKVDNAKGLFYSFQKYCLLLDEA